MHRIRTITLDLDDTLWPITPVIKRAERALWAWLAEHYPRIPAKWDRASAARLRASVVADHPDRSHDLRFLRQSVLARMAASCDYDVALVDPAFAVFDEQRNTVELFPDVESGLSRLRATCRLIALTNGNASLEKIGIRHLFDDVITAVAAGAAKPSPKIFELACERAAALPEEVLHVGDHPHLDVDGARAAGMRTAWVNRNGESWPSELTGPDATVTCMNELADWLLPLIKKQEQH
ncbi:MAG: HAD family hydrolase [Woeseia sp.]|nr:HAD family hydrolase [Woeseia sp.]MBT8097873.1 HAD family hydrolase [Woeseia sp.]NNE60271.1 HAD family hydrolase [Woeseia sp.]